MGVFIKESTRVLVQGLKRAEVAHHIRQMVSHHTQIVGCVSPGKGGEWFDKNIPIFETVQNAVAATGADTSVIFASAPAAADAIYEAIDADIQFIVCATWGIPLLDIIRVREYIRLTPSRLLGPSAAGVLVPGIGSIGTIPPDIGQSGSVGIVSRSGTLACMVTHDLTRQGIGQSAIVGIGGDIVLGTNFVDVLSRFEEDPDTKYVVMLGEIGSLMENEAAEYVSRMSKPTLAYIAGKHAPPNVQMGHRSAIVDLPGTDAQAKIDMLQGSGVRIAERYVDIPAMLMEWLQTQ